MLDDLSYFVTYTETPGAYVLPADKTKVPVKGKGTALIDFEGHIVQVPDCLHVPFLGASLYSIHHHHDYQGCSFIADNDGCFLTFLSCIINSNDLKDCLILI
eukprot:1554298-Ditylum_brightwellii.AAC.1